MQGASAAVVEKVLTRQSGGARTRVDRHAGGDGHVATSGVAIRSIGARIIGYSNQVSIGRCHIGVELDTAPGLQRQHPARAAWHRDGTGDRQVITCLKRDGGTVCQQGLQSLRVETHALACGGGKKQVTRRSH